MSRLPQDMLARLAKLQDLKTLEQRRDLNDACALTDERGKAVNVMTARLEAAEMEFGTVLAEPRLCLSHMALAAAVVHAEEDALIAEREAHGQACLDETEARDAWQLSRLRAEWFHDAARTAERITRARRDDRADAEGGQRIVLARSGGAA